MKNMKMIIIQIIENTHSQNTPKTKNNTHNNSCTY